MTDTYDVPEHSRGPESDTRGPVMEMSPGVFDYPLCPDFQWCDTPYALAQKLQSVVRWRGRNARVNVCSHSLAVAAVARHLADFNRGSAGRPINAQKLTLYALLHDVGEVFSGDIPTPYKLLLPPSSQKLLRDLGERAIQATWSRFVHREGPECPIYPLGAVKEADQMVARYEAELLGMRGDWVSTMPGIPRFQEVEDVLHKIYRLGDVMFKCTVFDRLFRQSASPTPVYI